MSVGFIGLGIMGAGMAANLLKDGHDLTIWNRTASRMTPLVDLGAIAAASPAEVAEQCDIIMICVSDTPDVKQVVLGDHGVLEGITAGTLIVDHSTISPSATIELADATKAKSAHWLDAPVSGGSEGAINGTLSIMIGGDATQLERAMPYLKSVGTTITHVGDQGAGQLAKVVNQILVVGNQLAVSEALLVAQAGGLDLNKTLDAVKGGAAGSWMLANRGPQMVVRDWTPGFTIDLQQKDLRLVLEAANDLGVPVPGTSLIYQLYRALQTQGLGSEGNHALVKALEDMCGIHVGDSDG